MLHTYYDENAIIDDSSDSDYDQAECEKGLDLVLEMYSDFGFEYDWEIETENDQ